MYANYIEACHSLLAEAITEAIARGEAELPRGATALDAAATVYAAANDWKHRSDDRAEFAGHVRTSALLVVRPQIPATHP
jgi:hypothetical protein